MNLQPLKKPDSISPQKFSKSLKIGKRANEWKIQEPGQVKACSLAECICGGNRPAHAGVQRQE